MRIGTRVRTSPRPGRAPHLTLVFSLTLGRKRAAHLPDGRRIPSLLPRRWGRSPPGPSSFPQPGAARKDEQARSDLDWVGAKGILLHR